MPLREFTDERGRVWQVWDTYPTHAMVKGGKVRERLASGWLTFEWDKVRCRLVPVPDGWATADEERLREWLKSAEDSRRGQRT